MDNPVPDDNVALHDLRVAVDEDSPVWLRADAQVDAGHCPQHHAFDEQGRVGDESLDDVGADKAVYRVSREALVVLCDEGGVVGDEDGDLWG